MPGWLFGFFWFVLFVCLGICLCLFLFCSCFHFGGGVWFFAFIVGFFLWMVWGFFGWVFLFPSLLYFFQQPSVVLAPVPWDLSRRHPGRTQGRWFCSSGGGRFFSPESQADPELRYSGLWIPGFSWKQFLTEEGGFIQVASHSHPGCPWYLGPYLISEPQHQEISEFVDPWDCCMPGLISGKKLKDQTFSSTASLPMAHKSPWKHSRCCSVSNYCFLQSCKC